MKTWIGFIIFTIATICCIVILEIDRSKINNLSRDNNILKDSLQLIIHNQNNIIDKFKQDSILYINKKAQIITKYEKIKSDYSNVIIVSDDSITNYISKKIYNK